tara:strand:+ start:1324 stop:2064 length:741 start_codon:yes stop_codon:yes gene_type:complete
MIERDELIREMKEEQKLRAMIRRGIKIVLEKKEKEKQQELLEEKRLRSLIRGLVTEVKGTADVADSVSHRNTGINILDKTLKQIIKTLESYYKSLTTSKVQRDSFRAHILANWKNSLAPVDIHRDAPGPVASLDEDLEEDIDINIADEDKFIPVRPEDQPEVEEEESFVRIPTTDPDELQGANFAEDGWNDVEKQILEPYEDLVAPEDAKAFYDYGLTNLKLYFDKFEAELEALPEEEPASPGYPN